MPKSKNMKTVMFRKHFSHSLENMVWYVSLLVFWSILLFCSVFGKEKWSENSFFSIFLQFLMHFLVPSGTNFITNMESEGEKKSNATSVGLRKCQQETISQYYLKLMKIYEIVMFVSNFSTSNIVRLSSSWSILLHWMYNFINLDKIIKSYVF